jgi:uncharacterized protein (TIGR03435 family)
VTGYAIANYAALTLSLSIVAALMGEPQAPPTPAFEVASVKVSRVWQAGGEGSKREKISVSPGSLTMRNVNLSSCLQWAYMVRFYQIEGPGWLNSDRYDILAKTSEPAPAVQLRLMLRALLAQRFKLTLHRESKPLPVYELAVAKGGPRLPASKGDGDSAMWVSGGSFVFQNMSMADFAERLSGLRGTERPVVDRTGIEGTFDFTLATAAAAILQDDGPSIFTLIQEQLGLKVEPRKALLEIIAVDHAERVPSEN